MDGKENGNARIEIGRLGTAESRMTSTQVGDTDIAGIEAEVLQERTIDGHADREDTGPVQRIIQSFVQRIVQRIVQRKQLDKMTFPKHPLPDHNSLK